MDSQAGQGAARAPPSVPSAASRGSLTAQPAVAAHGQTSASLASGSSVAADDFDALLNQLQFPGIAGGPAAPGATGSGTLSGGIDALGTFPTSLPPSSFLCHHVCRWGDSVRARAEPLLSASWQVR
jgi:hypothetical protein